MQNTHNIRCNVTHTEQEPLSTSSYTSTASSMFFKLKKENVQAPLNKNAELVHLLSALLQQEIFKSTEKQKLTAWIINNSPEAQKFELKNLVALIAEVVRPTFIHNISDETLDALLDIDERIQELIQKQLPWGKTCKELIDAYDSAEVESTSEVQAQKKSKLSEKLSDLLDGMQQSSFFTDLEKRKIQVWKTEIPLQCFDNLNGAEVSEIVSIALSNLLQKILEPAYSRTEKEDDQAKLFAMIKELKIILQQSLPNGENLDKYLQTYLKISREEQVFKKVLERAEAADNNATNQLYANANATDDVLVTEAEREQLELLRWVQGKRMKANKVNGKIDALTQAMNGGMKQMEHNFSELQPIADKLQQAHGEFRQRLQECQSMLNEAKI